MHEEQKSIIKHKINELGISYNADSKWYIAGGTLRSIFTNEFISDVDIFFESAEELNKFRDNDFKDCKPTFESDNAVTYNIKGKVVQLIKTKYGEAIDVINDFDFTICMCAFVPKIDDFVLNENFIKHINERTLCFNKKTAFTIHTLRRIKKFSKRKYTISPTEITKYVACVEDTTEDNYDNLNNQRREN